MFLKKLNKFNMPGNVILIFAVLRDSATLREKKSFDSEHIYTIVPKETRITTDS